MLLIIDVQTAFTDPSHPLGADASAEIAATLQLIAAARRAEVPIYFTGIRFEQPNQDDAGLWGEKIGALRELAIGTPGVAIDARLGVCPEDRIIWKKRASAFFNTDLVARLTLDGVDSLIVGGLTTSGCVRASAVDAIGYGYRTAIVREAVGDRAEAPHRQALFDLEHKYCDVISLAEALAYLTPRTGRAS